MRSLLNQTGSRNGGHGNRGNGPQHIRYHSSSMVPSQRPPVNSTQHANRQSEKYMDSTNVRANGHDRGLSVSGMISPQRPDTPYYDPNTGKYVKSPNLRLSFHSHIHSHRLRRSVHSVDLRSYATTTSTPSNEKVESGTTDSGVPLSISVQGNSSASGYSSDLAYGASFHEQLNEEEDEDNMKKVENWRLTARTGNGEWPKSPLTPRPFTSQELGGRVSYYEAVHGTRFYQEDDTPRPPIRARQPNPLQAINPIRDLANDWFPPSQEEEDVGTSFAALAIMHRAQEQVRLGVELPPLSPIGAYKIDHTMRGSLEAVALEGPDGSVAPVLEPSPSTKSRKKGDPVKVNSHPRYTPYNVSMHLKFHNMHEGRTDIDGHKKPSPLKLQPNVTEKLAVRDDPPLGSDPQTYTTKGLTQVLYKLYMPSYLPSDVLAALPSAEQLTSLSNLTTPAGALAFTRTHHSPNLPTKLSSKERNYVAYYIDTLLARNISLVQSISRLEEDVEDAEVSKAGLQAQINKWFFEARESKVRAQTLETFIEDLVVNVVPEDKKEEARGVAMGLGVEIGYVGGEDIGAGAAVKEVESKEKVVSKRDEEAGWRTRRLEEEVKYWKARAQAAETFVGALG